MKKICLFAGTVTIVIGTLIGMLFLKGNRRKGKTKENEKEETNLYCYPYEKDI